MTSPPIPPQAITAAAEARLRQYANEYSAAHLTWEDFAHEVTEVLEAARPHLAAAERQRIIAATSSSEDTRLGLFKLAAADGALRERERCAQLAEPLLTQWGLDARRLRSAGANEIDRAVARRLDTCAKEVAGLLRQEGGST